MDSKLQFKVCNIDKSVDVTDYLKDKEKLSSRFIRKSIRNGRVMVNGSPVIKRKKICKDDIIDIYMDQTEEQNIEPQKMNLDIVYEDQDILVVNKNPGIVVHPTKSYPIGTLSNGILYHFKETNQNCIVRLVSRLDMDTSGLVIIAKNQFAHMSLSRDMSKEEFKKEYIAIVHNKMEEKLGTIDLPIHRLKEDSIKRVVHENGQKSITHYKVLESLKKGDVVNLTLETGRTHQIRVHLTHLGHELYGDSLYGRGEEDKEYIKRQALHAWKLQFPHPRTGKILNLVSDLPQDMKLLIKKIK